jgi:hypothetical protein
MPTTWNPADSSLVTLSGSDLIATSTGGVSNSTAGIRTIDRYTSGKFYWEVTFNTIGQTTTGLMGSGPLTGLNVPTNSVMIYSTGNIWLNGVNVQSFPAFTIGQAVGIAVNLDGPVRRIWFRLAPGGLWNNTAGHDPGAGVGGIPIDALGSGAAIPLYACAGFYATGRSVTANFGATDFIGPLPTGFTSGLPVGSRPPTAALSTHFTLEQWAGNAGTQAWLTQAYLEQWGASPVSPVQVTQVSLEVFAENTTPAMLQLDRVALEEWLSGDPALSAAEVAQVVVEVWSINTTNVLGSYPVSGSMPGQSAIVAETTRGPAFQTALTAVITEGASAGTQTGITLMLQGVRATTVAGAVSYARTPVGVFAEGFAGSVGTAYLEMLVVPLEGAIATGAAGLIVGAITPQFAGVFAVGFAEAVSAYQGPAIFQPGVYAIGIGEPIYAIAGGIPTPFIFFMGGPF